jgi:hypothetical protein
MIADAPQTRPIRLRNDAGQRLRGRDLQDEHELQSWRRAVHVAALHDTWGIAIGFAGSLGAGEAIIGPGLAYDCFGREIVLSRDQHVPGPVAPSADEEEPAEQVTLVIRYNTGLDARAATADTFPCTDRGDRLGRDAPLFVWRRQGEVRLGLETPLLAARPTSDGLTDLDLSVRRYARAQTRPHIAAGTTAATQSWEPWEVMDGGSVFGIGVQTRVETSDAGFVGEPFYLAMLRAAPTKFARLAQFGVFTSVVDTGPDGFTLRVAKGRRPNTDDVGFASSKINTAPLRIDWMGVELVSGCVPLAQPQLVLDEILLLRSFATDLSLHLAPFGGQVVSPPSG